MGYSIWFSDCVLAIEAINKRLPNMETFNSIEGNAYGDFVIKNDTDVYIVKHKDFSVWHLEGDWKNGKWVEVK